MSKCDGCKYSQKTEDGKVDCINPKVLEELEVSKREAILFQASFKKDSSTGKLEDVDNSQFANFSAGSPLFKELLTIDYNAFVAGEFTWPNNFDPKYIKDCKGHSK